MLTSPDTFLRRIRRTTLLEHMTPRVLGVDDWAIRKGQLYGTILCDLEHRLPLEVLSERSAEVLAKWLVGHAGIEIISRDRGGSYAQGAARGAPAACQIADRWHLLHNLRDALVRLLDRHHDELRTAARTALRPIPRAPPTPIAPAPKAPVAPPITENSTRTPRSRRIQRFEQVRELHRQGIFQRRIARMLGLDRSTVARFANAESFPERAGRPYPPASMHSLSIFARDGSRAAATPPS